MASLSHPAVTAEPPGHGESAIRFEDVTITFEDRPVLDGVSFNLAGGETKIILGVAGAGKTTALKLALGLLKPDSGRIYVLGQEITGIPEEQLFSLRRKMGMVFQESALFDSLTVRENVAYRLHEDHDLDEDAIEQRVREALRFVELEHTLDMFPDELSGGMRRRVAIARAIVTQPAIVLYDSPTAGLDPVTSTTIIELLVKERDAFHTSSLMVTHRLQDAWVMATHVFDASQNRMLEAPPEARGSIRVSFLVLREGSVIFDGSALELAESADPYIREFIA
ncbi:MAG: ATP-binding cassette domain-containing protein [Acidobacteria bacterium]|nr:ATP-binding cassette domain-containing protein [Acidobacteriota bacterium]